MSLNQNKYTQPEFCIDVHKIPGIPLGRIYVRYFLTTKPEFSCLCQSVHIIEEKPYDNGDKVIWFVSSIAHYRSLATQFPHSRHLIDTEYLLTAAFTFFRNLKLPSHNRFKDLD